MIFTKLRIKNFGKFNDLELEFGDKLNIIYGPNEAGKSTILAFIKAMLYGMTSKKRSIRENDCLRFQPWHGDFGAGELYFKDEKNREFFIKRKLGNRRDALQVSDVQTGRRISRYERTAPGEVILGLKEAAFSRTIYVHQLGCPISPDKNDEIMARLMNLHQTGEEQVSLQKLLADLEKERKKLTISSGKGKLDILRKLRSDIQQEREAVEKLHEENITDQAELNVLGERKTALEEKISDLEKNREIIKKHKQYLEYERLRTYQEELNSLEKDLAQIEKDLLCGDNLVDGQFLQEVKTKIIDWQNKDKQAQDLEKELQDKSLAREKVAGVLKESRGFAELGDVTEAQVFLKEQNKKALSEKLFQLEKERKEKEELERQLEEKKSGLGSLAAFYNLTPAEEEEMTKNEELRQRLEDELKKDIQVDSLRRDLIKDKLKNAQIFMVAGLVAVVAGIILGWFFHPVSYLISLIGVILGCYGFFQARKQKADLSQVEMRISGAAQRDSLRRELEQLTGKLNDFYRRFGAADSRQFAALRRKFESENNEIAIIDSKISDRTDRLSGEEEKELRKQMQECADYLQNILDRTASKSLPDFYEKWQAFSKYKKEKENLDQEIAGLKNRLEQLFSQMQEGEKAICGMLQIDMDGREVVREAERLVKEYEGKLARKNELVISFETNKKNFQERLAGRDFADLAAAASAYRMQGIYEPAIVENEEELEINLKELNEERLDTAQRITGLEERINSRFHHARDLSIIDGELEQVTAQINRYEEILDALDLTKNVFNEAFEELQHSFAPALNKNVSAILKKITRGTYSEVGVADDYSITIKDNTQWGRELDFFSNGTLDQVYFALRLGIIGLAYDSEMRLPLILDDSFVQYDDVRLASVLEYLNEYAQEHQVLLFTCHRREAEILQGQEFKFIVLET